MYEQPLGAEDDIFSEVALGTVGGSHLRLLINGWPKSDREASWLEQEVGSLLSLLLTYLSDLRSDLTVSQLCPITTFVYINVDPDSAVKRTSERAVYAVKTGHRLFHTISDDMIDDFKKRGKLIEVSPSIDSIGCCAVVQDSRDFCLVCAGQRQPVTRRHLA